MTSTSYESPKPDLVQQAEAFAHAQGFQNSCLPEVGRCLRTLAAQVNGAVLELGSGCGVSSAWLISGLKDSQRFISIDQHAQRQAYLQHHFAQDHDANITFMTGDWPEALAYGPFQLVFVDVASAKDTREGAAYSPADVIAATAIGGLLVLDDFEPGPLFQGKPDARWHTWMHHPQLATCEVLTTPTTAMLLAARAR